MSLLPSVVRSRLAALSEGVKRSDLAVRSGKITDNYLNKRNSSVSMHKAEDALAYAIARMPATFAATHKAIAAMLQATDALAPKTILDVGCGPGTAAIAALEAFASAEAITLMDRNGPFLKLAVDLVGTMLVSQSLSSVDCDIQRQPEFPKADLVLASYVMVEMDVAAATALATKLWSSTGQALVLVEPGTPEGFKRLLEIRQTLIGQGANVAAPCTHENICPMPTAGDNWCRFMARVQRSRDHRMLKEAALAYEDEPYAYLALLRPPVAGRKSHRIVGRNAMTKIGVSLPACGKDGLETLYASKREAEKHKYFKKLDWSDAVQNLSLDAHLSGEEAS
ncbi:MAG: small ribosomal subunit Rsm22 family protein [Beijerinckiaceae bacterium]